MMPDLTAIIKAHQLPDHVVLPGWSEFSCGRWKSEKNMYREHPAHVAEAIREAHTIRTIEELDALPVWAVILDGDPPLPAQKNEQGAWRYAGDFWEPRLPCQLIWTPEAE